MEAVLVANTPSFYWIVCGRILLSVRTGHMSPPEIIKVLREALARPVQDVTEIVPRYVYLAALSTVDPQDQALWQQICHLIYPIWNGGTYPKAYACEAVLPPRWSLNSQPPRYMRVQFALCAQSASVDRNSNRLSIFNVIDHFPLLVCLL